MTKSTLLVALVISSYVGVAFSYGDFYLFHLVLILLLVFNFYDLKQNDFKVNVDVFLKKYIPTLVLILSWFAFSLFWAPRIDLGLKYVFYIFCGFSVVLSIVSYAVNKKRIDKIIYILTPVVLIEIAIAIIESFTTFRMPISSYSSISDMFGKEPVNFSEFDNSLISSILKPPTGFRWNTNDLAICMILVLPFFLCSKKTSIKFIGIISILTIVIMTASRAVFIALLLIFTTYLFLIKKRIGTLILIWFSIASLFFGMFQLRNSENPRINELANSLQAVVLYFSGELDLSGSLEWRRQLINNGLDAYTKTYGLGLGAGGSTANQEMAGPVAGRFTSMHNFWVEFFVEASIFISLMFFLWIINIAVKLLVISRKSLDDKIKYYSQSLFLSLIGLVPAAVAASSTVYFFPMWIVFGLSISVITNFKEN